MIIRKLEIENFRSYYGENNVFEFGDGLTLILGDNGDGKTTFFEALQWLFDVSKTDEIQKKHALDDFSEMKKSKLENGESANLRVYMEFVHDGYKSIEKSLTITKNDDNYVVDDYNFKGTEELDSGRVSCDGRELVLRCFDAEMQYFSMFKGESRLDVLDGPEALKKLVNTYSDIKNFDRLVELTSIFEGKSDRAYIRESKNDEKTKKTATEYDTKLIKLSREIQDLKKEINEKTATVNRYETMLQDLEQNQETRDRYNDLSQNLKRKRDRIVTLRANIDKVNLNTSLLDQYWIMCDFPKILTSFRNKCTQFRKEKERLNEEFILERGRELGELNALRREHGSLVNGTTELPWYLPTPDVMDEMIKDRICKVCGRPAEEHSEAYKFMVNKLEKYKNHIAEETKIKEEQARLRKKRLFTEEHIEDMNALSHRLSGQEEAKISGIANEINNRLEVVAMYSYELAQVRKEVDEIENDISRLLIQAGNISEEVIKKDSADVTHMFKEKGKAEKDRINLEHELADKTLEYEDLKEKMNKLQPGNSMSRLYQKVHIAFDQIAKASVRAKENNLHRFLQDLKDNANKYMDMLSTRDFHGEISLFYRKEKDEAGIRLRSSSAGEETYIKKPSDSQKTVMYISILFAVSDFAYNKREEQYPLIFDAATSSFGDSKEEDFYNTINSIDKQCIIVTKDFITAGEVRKNDIEHLDCKVYRIAKAEGFNNADLSTVRTIVKEEKKEK